MKRWLRKIFPSLFPSTEYVASSGEGLRRVLKCRVAANKNISFETAPLFLGYKPLVMGVVLPAAHISSMVVGKNIQLRFLNKQEKAAEIALLIDKIIPIGNLSFALCTGVSGVHQFETGGERIGFWLRENILRKSATNIDLTRSEYDQLKIAYSVPREIKVLTVFKGESGNIFPIDLFGYVDQNHFVLSLRHEKNSSQQLEIAGQIIAWSVRADSAASTYSLGKNHSAGFGRAVLPVNPLGSDELELSQLLGDYGVHRLYLLKIRDSIRGKDEDEAKLVHVHRSYVNWHKRQGFPMKEITR